LGGLKKLEFGSEMENCDCWKFSHVWFWAAFKITAFGELDKRYQAAMVVKNLG